MNLTIADRRWLCKLAAILVRSIVAAVIAGECDAILRECTVVAVGAAKRIEALAEMNPDEIDNEGFAIRKGII